MGVPPMSSVTSPAILGFSELIIRAPPRTRRLAAAFGRNACALPVSSASATASLTHTNGRVGWFGVREGPWTPGSLGAHLLALRLWW